MARKESSPPPLPPSFRLRALRDAVGKAKSEVARELGASIPAYTDWEDGTRSPCDRGNPYIIEAWTRRYSATVGRPDLVIYAIEWLPPKARARVAKLAPSMLVSP